VSFSSDLSPKIDERRAYMSVSIEFPTIKPTTRSVQATFSAGALTQFATPSTKLRAKVGEIVRAPPTTQSRKQSRDGVRHEHDTSMDYCDNVFLKTARQVSGA